MPTTSIIKLKPIFSISLVVFLSLISTANGLSVAGNLTETSTNLVNGTKETNNTSSDEISLPKVQSRFFRWLFDGLSGQTNSNGGLTSTLGASNSPLNRQGISFNSDFSGLTSGSGFRRPMGPPQMGQSSMGPPPMGPPPMGPPPMGPPPMGPPPMGLPPMGPPPMGSQSWGSQSMGSPFMRPSPSIGSQSMNPSQMGQSSMGLPPYSQSMGFQGEMGPNFNQNGQLNGQMNGFSGGFGTTNSLGDDGGGGDFFTELGNFLFGPTTSNGSSGGSCGGDGGNNGGRGDSGRLITNTNGQSASATGGSSMGMSSEDWSNYIKLIQTLASDGGGSGSGGSGGGLGDLNSLISSASSVMQSFSG